MTLQIKNQDGFRAFYDRYELSQARFISFIIRLPGQQKVLQAD